jgi:hypothetical protein
MSEKLLPELLTDLRAAATLQRPLTHAEVDDIERRLAAIEQNTRAGGEVYVCNKCGYAGHEGPEHDREDGQRCNYWATKRIKPAAGSGEADAEMFRWLAVYPNLHVASDLLRKDQYATLRRCCEALMPFEAPVPAGSEVE